MYQFKVFADDKIRVTRKLKFVVGRLENIVGERENAERQHFFLFPQCFQKGHYDSKFVISRDCGKELNKKKKKTFQPLHVLD